MADNIRRKCLKCGRSPKEDSDIRLYRFPNPGSTNESRCVAWAKFCFSDMDNSEWPSVDFHKKLYAEHRMLCNYHFKDSAFTDFAQKKLNRYAVPDVQCVEQVHDPSQHVMEPMPGPSTSKHKVIEAQAGPSRILKDITNIKPITRQVHGPSQHVMGPMPGPSTSKHEVIEAQAGPSHILKDITNIKPVAKSIRASNENKSEKEKNLLKKCRLYVKKISKLRKTIKNKKKLDSLTLLLENDSFAKLAKRLTPSFAILLQSQLRNVRKQRKGRRWTFNEKLIALRLYKRSPMCYRLLRRMWCLPTPATLKSLLSKFELTVGINQNILNTLQEHAKSLQSSDNEFILMFDEMSLKKHLEYKTKLDIIEGYQDHGPQHGRSEQEATHALVFMVAGIRKKVKQPIAFYLSSAYVTADRLTVIIKEVLHACFNIGLKIAAIVCDMAGVNRRALTILGATKEQPYFSILNNEVVALFDPPHLLKSFRNLFLKYNIRCTTNIQSNTQTGQSLAKWSHIKDFYELDNKNKNFVFAPALRKEHLNPNTREKMRVKLAAQVLSHSVAAGMFAKIATGELPSEATATADLISNIDKLFDLMNSNSPDLRRGKPFSTNFSQNSPHANFFNIMKKYIANMQFVGSSQTPPSQQGWIWSINAVERLWRNLCMKHRNIKSLSTRRLQQDPIENLFGTIRANCGANSNPTVGQFIAALKTAIMSNLAHLSSGNCEQDENKCIINNFKKIFTPTPMRTADDAEQELEKTPCLQKDSVDECFTELSSTESAELQACAYVCGYLLKRKKNYCKTCNEFLLQKEVDYNLINFMQFKEYDDLKKSLTYASKSLVNCVESCATIINDLLRTKFHTLEIRKTITNIVKTKVDFSFMTCHQNENVDFIVSNVFYICVKRFCTLKNRQYKEETSNMLLGKKINILKHK